MGLLMVVGLKIFWITQLVKHMILIAFSEGSFWKNIAAGSHFYSFL